MVLLGQFQVFKNPLRQFVSNRPPKHVITRTNVQLYSNVYNVCITTSSIAIAFLNDLAISKIPSAISSGESSSKLFGPHKAATFLRFKKTGRLCIHHKTSQILSSPRLHFKAFRDFRNFSRIFQYRLNPASIE